MRFFNGCISAFLIALLSSLSMSAQSAEEGDLSPRITRERTVSCPLKLDTNGLETEKDVANYLWRQVFAELPYERMHNSISHKTDIRQNQILTSNGGYFRIRDDRNSVSQLYCDYRDNNGRFVYLIFNFRTDLTFHVKGFLPETPGQMLFSVPGELNCAALNDLNVPEKPHCQLTLANVLVTNMVEVGPVFNHPKNPNFYGHLSYKPVLDNLRYVGDDEHKVSTKNKNEGLIKPGETRAYPVSLDHPYDASVRVKLYERSQDVSELCIDKWLPKANMLVKYGASPHIIITGKVGYDGNLKKNFKCEMRCNEKEDLKDCWDVWTYEKFLYYLSWGKRPDMVRNFLLTEVNKAYQGDYSSESTDVLKRKYQAIEYYRTLGVEPGTPAAEYRKASRTLSAKLHPDKSKDHEEKFYVVQTAKKRLDELTKKPDEDKSKDEPELQSHQDL